MAGHLGPSGSLQMGDADTIAVPAPRWRTGSPVCCACRAHGTQRQQEVAVGTAHLGVRCSYFYGVGHTWPFRKQSTLLIPVLGYLAGHSLSTCPAPGYCRALSVKSQATFSTLALAAAVRAQVATPTAGTEDSSAEGPHAVMGNGVAKAHWPVLPTPQSLGRGQLRWGGHRSTRAGRGRRQGRAPRRRGLQATRAKGCAHSVPLGAAHSAALKAGASAQ